jgi:hypothetical protein
MFRILHDQTNRPLMQRKAETRVCGQRVYHDMNASGREYTHGGLPTQNIALLQVICVTFSLLREVLNTDCFRSRVSDKDDFISLSVVALYPHICRSWRLVGCGLGR